MSVNTRLWGVSLLAVSVLLPACGDERVEPVDVVQRAATQCTFAAPTVAEIREETPGPVAPGISKVYFVTVRNQNSGGCAPTTLTLVPDSAQFFSAVAQPSSISGVASGATTQFRVTVTSDPSVTPATYSEGFTVVSNPGGTSVRGFLPYTATFDNPTGCNRQRVSISIDNANPAPVPPGTAVTYRITARNVDNRECGQDVFRLQPCALHFFNVSADGPFTIFPQSSAVFTLTLQPADFFGPGTDITECFDVAGDRHLSPELRASGTVRYRTQ